MSYGLYKYIVAKELSGSSDVTYRIELLKNGYSGSSEQLEGAENYFEHTYNKIDPRNPFENPVQASQLTMSFHVQGQSELDLLEEIFGADENQYILQKKVNGSVVWQGKVLNDLLEYDEGDYPFPGRIVAKDLSYLKGIDYTLEDNNEKIILTLAGALNELGFGLNIYTYTNWVENNQTNTSDDFLNQVYNSTYAFRNYGSSTEQDDTAISQYDVIDRICRNYNLILRQSNNAWHLFHISALDDPTSVKRYSYDSNGAPNSPASSTEDLTVEVDSTDLYVLPFSGNKINPAVKKANVIFEHRTGTSQTLVNASRISSVTDPALPTAEYSISFKGSGDEFVEVSGRSYAITSRNYLITNANFPQASYLLKSSQYYWDDDAQDWVTYDNITSTRIVSIAPSQIDIPNDKIQISSSDFRHGDIIRVDDALTSGTNDDTEYYLIDVSGELGTNYYQLSETPDGTPVSLGSKTASSYNVYRVNSRKPMGNNNVLLSGVTWWYDFNFTTTNIPSDSDTDIQFYAMSAIMPPITTDAGSDFWEYADTLNIWVDTLVNVKDPVTANGDSFLYELEQNSGNYSTLLSYPGVYFGDGPLDYSRSALLVSVTTPADTPTSQWDFVGGSTNSNFFEIWLKEVLNVQRTARRNLRAELYGEFEAYQVLSHDSKYFFFLGGTQRGNGNRWDADFFEIDIETGTDTFVEIVNAQNSAGTGGSGGGTSASAEGLTVDFADARYLQISNDLSDVDDVATARTNLGLEIGTDVQAQNELLEDISGLTITDGTFLVGDGSGDIVAESGDTARTSLGLGTGDSPTFAGLTVNGNISVTGNVDGRDVSADGTNLDTILAIGVQDLTSTEVDQLENIDSVTISNTQWGYLGDLDQSLTTFSNVEFDDITSTGTIYTDNIDTVSIVWSTSTQVFNTSIEYFNNPVFIGTSLDVDNDLEVDGYANIGTDLDVGGTLGVTGNTTLLGTLTLSGSADFNSTMNLQGNLTTQADLQDDGFSSGWAGTNWKIGADGSAEFEEMRIRGALRVYEFIAKQISTIGGSEILSIAQGRIASLDVGTDTITVENVTGTPGNAFKANDLWICQVVDINNDLESGGTGSIVKSVHGTVDYVSGNDIVVTIDAGDITELEQGDLIIAYGNTSDADRQAIMYRNVDRSEDNLIMRLQTEVNSFADLQAVTNTRVAFGDLNRYSGLSSETFGFFAGKNAEQHVLVTDTGIFFKNGSTVGAQLSSNIFKIGDDDNFLSFNTSNDNFEIKVDTFDLNTSFIQIADSISKTSSTLTSSVAYSGDLSLDGLFFNADNYFGYLTDVEAVESNGYVFRVGGNTSNFMELNTANGIAKIVFDTFDLDSTNLIIDSANSSVTIGSSGFLEDSSQNYRLNGDGLKINTYGLSSKGGIGIDGSIAFGQYSAGYGLSNYGSYIGSYNNGGTISQLDSTLYLYGTRAVHLDSDEGIIILDNLPTSASGLPSGAIYNSSGTLKIV